MDGAAHTMWSNSFSMSGDVGIYGVEEVRLARLYRDTHVSSLTMLEWHWGLQKGQLDPSSKENHLSLRSDMKKKFREYDWTLMPTPETLRTIQQFVAYNAEHPNARKSIRQVFDTEVFEYFFVPLMMNTAPSYPAVQCRLEDGSQENHVHPYTSLPLVLSRAHPFFVVLAAFSHIRKGGTHLSVEEKRRNFGAILDLGRAWLADAPPEFVRGLDVWKAHRYPYSDDGSVAFEQLHGSRSFESTASPNTSVRSSCRYSIGSTAGTSLPASPSRLPLSVHSPRKIRFAGDGGILTAVERRFVEHRPSPLSIGAWRTTADGIPEETDDDELASYVREPAPDPEAIIRAGMKCMPVRTGNKQHIDTSRCCSNDFARLLFDTVLASPGKAPGKTKPVHRRAPSSALSTPRKVSDSASKKKTESSKPLVWR